MARQLADLVDAFELGPRLLQAEGPAFVNALRGTVPNRPVACWAETEAGTQALLEVGVEGLTVPASLSDEALAAIVFRCRQAGRRMLLDCSSVVDPAAEHARFRRLKPDCVKIPVTVTLREVMTGLRDTEIPVAFSAGWSVAQVPWLLLYRPVALIAGAIVTAVPEPRRVVEAIRARMTVTPTMSRFY
jgi:3-keto-L-gulonate-6-phosphate decarboxylase